MTRALVIAFSLLMLGCSQHGGRLLVLVRSDITVPTTLNRLEVRAQRTGGATPDARTLDLFEATDLPLSFVVSPREASEEGVVITVDGYAPGRPVCRPTDSTCRPLVSRQVITGFSRGTTRLIEIFLGDACRNVDCTMPRDECETLPCTCDAGRCIEVPVVDPDGLIIVLQPCAELDGGCRDVSGLDAPRPDVLGTDVQSLDVPADGPTDVPSTSDTGVPAPEQLLVALDGEPSDQLGHAVAINHDGTLAVFGAPGDSAMSVTATGTARVWSRSGPMWAESRQLTQLAPRTSSSFGHSVGVAAADPRVVVGAPFAGAGEAYVFVGPTWALESSLRVAPGAAANDDFGFSVGLDRSGSRAFVGAPSAPATGEMDGRGFLYERSGASWTMGSVSLRTTTGNPSDALGFSGAISADGSTIILGAPFAGTGGVAVVFDAAGAIDAVVDPPTSMGAFGLRVGASGDGRRAIAAGNSDATVFTRTTSWVPDEPSVLRPMSPLPAGALPAVAIDASGRRALVASPDVVPGGGVVGSVTVFESTATTPWTPTRELRASDGVAGDEFGRAVAISGDGQWVVVGAPGRNEDRGGVYVFSLGP